MGFSKSQMPKILSNHESKTSDLYLNVLKLGSAIKNLGLFSKSPGDFRIEKMDFYSSLGRSTPGVLLPRLP